jgi:hypothetical protein
MMGGPGDHPRDDLLRYGMHPFVPQIERLVRAIAAITPEALHETKLREARWFAWARGEQLDQAVRVLASKLRDLERETERPPSLAASDYEVHPVSRSPAASSQTELFP